MVAVNSLELAVSLLAEDEAIGAIEIWGDIEVPIEGLTLELGGNLNHPLVIRGKAEQRSTLRITLSESALETNVPAFIDVFGGQITFENLNIIFTLPEEFRQGWSLFRLNGLSSFNLVSSIITVLPPEDPANQQPVNVAVFDCVSSKSTPQSSNTTSQNTEHALLIDIGDAFLRGPIHLIRNRHQLGVTLLGQMAFSFHQTGCFLYLSQPRAFLQLVQSDECNLLRGGRAAKITGCGHCGFDIS